MKPTKDRADAGRKRRGVALIIAVAVLTAMFLMALPFARFMQMQHSAGTQALNTARARSGETGALSHAKTILYRGLRSTEDPTGEPVFPYDTPDMDSLWEFRVTLRTRTSTTIPAPTGTDVQFDVDRALGIPNDGDPATVDGFIRVVSAVGEEWMGYSGVADLDDGTTPPPAGPGVLFPGGELTVPDAYRGLFGTQVPEDAVGTQIAHPAGAIVSFFPEEELWSLDIQDQQARINVNTAPYRVILNLLGYLEIGGVPAGTAGPLPGAAGFPNDRQRYLAWAISSYRTNSAYWAGETEGRYTPFQNLDMIKNISLAEDSSGSSIWDEATRPPLSADELDRLRPYLTVHSTFWANATIWQGPLALESDMAAGAGGAWSDPVDATGNTTSRFVANLDDASKAAVGSTVRFTWDDAAGQQHREYRTVLARNTDVPGPRSLTEDLTAAGGDIYVDSAAGWAGQSDQTPGYLKIDSEWIRYVDMERNTLDPSGDPCDRIVVDAGGRGVFGTTAVLHTDGTTIDGSVISWESSEGFSWPLDRDYTVADPPEIHVENRHYLNINTVNDPIVLQSVLNGVASDTNEINSAEAGRAADALLERTSGGAGPPYSFFDDDEDWFDTPAELDSYLIDAGTGIQAEAGLDPGDGQLLSDNFSTNPVDWPAVSTAPLDLVSGTLVGIDSLGQVDDRAGTPVAQSPRSDALALGRVYNVVPPLEPIWWFLRSQQEFFDHIAAGGSSAVGTTELNTTLTEAVLLADSEDRYTDRAPGVGAVTPMVGTLGAQNTFVTLLQGLHGAAMSLDLDTGSNGTLTEAGGVTPGTQNTTADGITDVRLQYETDYDQAAGARNVEADPFHYTMQPFALEFWMRPGDDLVSRQLILDLGDGDVPAEGVEDAFNQVRVYLDNSRIEVRIDDPIYDATVGGVSYGGYVIARSSADFPLESDVWHHVAIAAVGTYRDEIALFIDGIYDENMGWEYDYVDDTGAASTADETTVTDSYFWPVAMEVPNDSTVLANDVGPLANSITLSADIGLPPDGGMIIIHRNSDGQEFTYRYDSAVGTTVNLSAPIGNAHRAGDPVVSMIPLVQTDVQWQGGTKSVPDDSDRLGLWGHSDTGSGTSYDSDLATDMVAFEAGTLVDETTDHVVDAGFPGYFWVGFSPLDFPLEDSAGVNIDLGMDNHWKVFDYDALTANQNGVLAGVLPSGPLGPEPAPGSPRVFSVGGDRDGVSRFVGELDEVRLTALPVALVDNGGWTGGSANAQIRHWEWNVDDEAELLDGAACPVGATPMPTTGGYFIAEGELYSYSTYDNNPASGTYGEVDGIQQVERDLTPSGVANLVATGHNALHRVIPLTFIETTTLASDFPDAGLPGDEQQHIPVEDHTAFPQMGYVQIGGEIVGYSGKDTDAVNGWDRLLRPRPLLAAKPNAKSAFPREAYGTDAPVGGHGVGAVVRHVPVRHFDRYRFESGWTDHDDYSNTQLATDMCMFSFGLDAAGSQLKKIKWRFKEPMEEPQRLIVMINLDPATVNWDQAPDDVETLYVDTVAGEKVVRATSEANAADLLWGFELDSQDSDAELDDVEGVKECTLWIYDSAGEHPTVPARVEVRFYFDLSFDPAPAPGTFDSPYRFSYDAGTDTVQQDGWQTMMELDTVGIEMVPEPTTF